jgi:hypothetical protein
VNLRKRSAALNRLAEKLRARIDRAAKRGRPNARLRQRLRHVGALLADLDARAG